MDFAVLVKVVPALDELRFDPERRTVRRDSAELFLNPFDQRALQVALQLRRPRERLTVVSMGPPAAAPPLRDALVLGADRVQLVSDPRLAGSDTLATARTLAAAVRRVAPDVVVGGAWTTDSETGQVGPELAALLGWPVLTGARAIARAPEGPGFTVTVDIGEGWASYRAAAPLVLTVGEKIAKPGKVAAEDRARVPESRVERLTLDDLGVPPGLVGLVGSPTEVRSVVEDAPRRSPTIVDGGTPAERVARAVEVLRPLLARPAPESARPDPLPPLLEPRGEVLVAVTDGDGRLDPRTLPAISEVRRSLPGHWPSAVWVGASPTTEDAARVGRARALAGYHVPVAPLPANSRTFAAAVGVAIDHRPAAAGAVFLGDPFGREVAGQLAGIRELGLTGDAVAVRRGDAGELVWTKPSFGGRTLAEIVSRTRPSLATVRPGAFEPGAPQEGSRPLLFTRLAGPTVASGVARTGSGAEVAPGAAPLEGRDVVVAVGMGVGGPGGVAALAPLLARWRAGLGATRKVVDAGWVPRQFQVGLTGRALAPRLGVLLGVGGSANHLVGWRRTRALLAVNRDPSAPVFRDVDVGIVGSLEEIVPLLGDALAPWLGR